MTDWIVLGSTPAQIAPAVAIVQTATLDASSAAVVAGDSSVSANQAANANVTRATSAAFANAPALSGVVISGGNPSGTIVTQATGNLPASVTGLGSGAISTVAVSPTTGKLVRVALPDGSEVSAGKCDANGNVALSLNSYVGTSPEMIVNVKCAPYFAKGDGSTDDTAAINAAIAAITTYGILYFPAGTYKITSQLSTLPSNCVVRGPSTGTYTAQPAAVIKTANDIPVWSFSGKISLHFERIGFLCTHSSPTAQALTLIDSPYSNWQHVAIQGFGYGLVLDHVPMASASSFNTTLFACNIISNATTNIYAKANSSANALVMIGTEFGGASQNGLVFLDSDNLSIMGGGCEETALLAIDIDNTNGARLQCGDSITGCHFEYSGASTPATAMIRVGHTGKCEGGVISGCVFVTNNNVAPGPPIILTPGNSKYWVVEGPTFQGFTPAPAYQNSSLVATSPMSAPKETGGVITSAYTIDSSVLDDIVRVSTAVAAVSVTMPPPSKGLRRRVVDIGGVASGRLITVLPNGGEVFFAPGASSANAGVGVASLTVPGNNGHLDLCSLDGVNWYVLDGPLAASIGLVYNYQFTTVVNGAVNFLQVPLPVAGSTLALDVRITGYVTVAGATANVGDAILYESQIHIKNVGGVFTNIAQSTGTANVFADTSQQGAQVALLGYQGTAAGYVKVGVQQGGAPNVGASIRWQVSAQVASSN